VHELFITHLVSVGQTTHNLKITLLWNRGPETMALGPNPTREVV